jgi:branched-chain amino acid transport system permease protein
MESFVNALVSTLTTGSLYAIMALGLTIIYGVSRVFNFGHGIVAVLSAYFTWLFLGQLNLGLLPSILLSLPIMALFGWLVYRYSINPLLHKPNWEFSTVLFMLGLGILLENVILQVFGPRVKSIPVFFAGSLSIGFVRIAWHEISLILIVVLALVALNVFFRHARMGQAMRAVAQSIPGARVVGIDVERIFGYTFALAFAATGFSGILLGTKYYMTPHIGWDWMVKGFVIVTFGGLGSTTGAIYAALILGLVEALVTLYLGAIWVWPIWFAIFIVVLLLRPQGIAGGRM